MIVTQLEYLNDTIFLEWHDMSQWQYHVIQSCEWLCKWQGVDMWHLSNNKFIIYYTILIPFKNMFNKSINEWPIKLWRRKCRVTKKRTYNYADGCG